ncbi:recombination mediator RecR [Mycoplasma sp. (ex Biomphalaria glabrata)]|uniref:recombination mediator RecR n=1 Tax=Mycoplasma sp. (ex Biomphalaria glabrata) TaxID=1749074 RepID=UPI000ADE7958|nr:recombination mediator RecR [Mycoplasma sp. (ex Biomphalaria glabrata)]
MKNNSLEKLIDEIATWPGIGKKTAQKLAIFLVQREKSKNLTYFQLFNDAILNLKSCKVCNTISENEICEICINQNRDSTKLCIVEKPEDLNAIETTNQYNGKYFIFYNDLDLRKELFQSKKNQKFNQLLNLIKDNNVDEVILALNPTLEGEILSKLIINNIKNQNILITKLAIGLSLGSNINYVDKHTLITSFRNRRKEEECL